MGLRTFLGYSGTEVQRRYTGGTQVAQKGRGSITNRIPDLQIEWFPQIPELKMTSRSGQSVLTKEGKVVWVHGKTPPFVLVQTR